MDDRQRYCQIEPVAATIIRWNLYIVAIAFLLKSLAALCGSTIGSPSAFEMSRICWRNAVSSFPMRPFLVFQVRTAIRQVDPKEARSAGRYLAR